MVFIFKSEIALLLPLRFSSYFAKKLIAVSARLTHSLLLNLLPGILAIAVFKSEYLDLAGVFQVTNRSI